MPTASPEEATFCTVSTGHLTPLDRIQMDLLSHPAGFAPMTIAKYREGYIVSMAPGASDAGENVIQELRCLGFSEGFCTLWEGMRARGYGMMCLDADAPVLAGYPSHAW